MTENTADRPRWHYRFEHYRSAYALLQQSCNEYAERPFSDLEKEGLVARFSFTWELGWKLLKDYLIFEGVRLETIAPRPVIRSAMTAQLIDDSATWMDALDARNGIAHTYSRALRDETVDQIRLRYIVVLRDLHTSFSERFDAAV